MSLVEKRYAEALIKITVKSENIYDYLSNFKLIVDTFENNIDFKYLILNPKIPIDTKYKIIDNVFGDFALPELVNFVKLLLRKLRIKHLRKIYDEYLIYFYKFTKTLNMQIISALELSESQINLLIEKYKKIYNSTDVKTSVKINKGLIGGVKIIIGDKVTDASVKGNLENLKSILIKK